MIVSAVLWSWYLYNLLEPVLYMAKKQHTCLSQDLVLLGAFRILSQYIWFLFGFYCYSSVWSFSVYWTLDSGFGFLTFLADWVLFLVIIWSVWPLLLVYGCSSHDSHFCSFVFWFKLIFIGFSSSRLISVVTSQFSCVPW